MIRQQGLLQVSGTIRNRIKVARPPILLWRCDNGRWGRNG
ncbi:hypothetical protein [Azospirillum endophyticum]